MKSSLKNWIFLVLILVGILFLPRILTSPHLYNWENFDFSSTGQIGDTIGGITAPFIGLISAILVYLSFLKQTEANKLVSDQFKTQRTIDIENEQFSLLVEKIKDWKKEMYEFKFTSSDEGISRKLMPKGTYVGANAFTSIFTEIVSIGNSGELEGTQIHRIRITTSVSNKINDILVYLYAIIPSIKSIEKLKLIFFELESINRDLINVSPNCTNILSVDHTSKPVGTKEKYQLIKKYTIRNYQMLKIEKQLFDYFNPNYNYENDSERKLKYSPIERVEFYLTNDSEYRNEVKAIDLNRV